MTSSDRSVAQKNSDSQGGHRSLAGFVYQLLGTAAESVELVRLDPKAPAIEGLITIEQFGQDSFVARVPETSQSRFTQYKHSLNGEQIQPAELREILERFVASVDLADLSISESQFVLATDREPADWTNDLKQAQQLYQQNASLVNEEGLRALLWKSTRKVRPTCADDMLEIMKKLIWQSIDHAKMKVDIESRAFELGVTNDETADRIRRVLGLFLERSVSKTFRSIFRSELDDALAGHPRARTLRCDDARRHQRQSVEDALDRIHRNKPVARRTSVQEIADASLAYPLVIVVGDGGRGKSAAAWRALLEHLENENRPPDFAVGLHFSEFTKENLVEAFACWRNQTSRRDGANLEVAFERLAAACPHPNLLVLYVDGIDEKEGRANPYPANQRFVEALLQQIVQLRKDEQRKQISLVVSCRTVEEARWLTGLVSEQDWQPVELDEFSDLQLEELAESLEEKPCELILRVVSADWTSKQKFSKLPRPNFLEPLREPRVWAAFAELDSATQTDCLLGSVDGKRRLAQGYVRRIEEKAAKRLAMELDQHVIESILEASGKVSLTNPSEMCTKAQWAEVCKQYFFDASASKRLFDEFVTSGLFTRESEHGERWAWKQIWLREILCTQEVIQ